MLDALTAAYMLREMALQKTADPMTEAVMIENAKYFEGLAVAVQVQAMKENQEQAQECMCRPLGLWRRWTLLDLAMNV